MLLRDKKVEKVLTFSLPDEMFQLLFKERILMRCLPSITFYFVK